MKTAGCPAATDAGKMVSKTQQRLIYVICGKDGALVGTRCRELVSELLGPEQKATGLLSVEGDQISASEVLDELRTLPFLSDKRVVVVRAADEFISQNRQLLEKYFDAPCSSGRLILCVESWQSSTHLARKLGRVGSLVNAAEPKAWELPGRLVKYAAEAHEKKLALRDAQLIVELIGDKLGELYSEIDKLSVFVGGERGITREHIEKLLGHNRLFGAFEVIDAMVSGRTAGAAERLRRMFAEDRSAEYAVVGAFAFHFRRMFNAKMLLDGGTGPDEVAKKFRIWSNQEAVFSQLRRLSLRQIGGILERLAEIDFQIKTGRTRAAIAIEQVVLELSSQALKQPAET